MGSYIRLPSHREFRSEIVPGALRVYPSSRLVASVNSVVYAAQADAHLQLASEGVEILCQRDESERVTSSGRLLSHAATVPPSC